MQHRKKLTSVKIRLKKGVLEKRNNTVEKGTSSGKQDQWDREMEDKAKYEK